MKLVKLGMVCGALLLAACGGDDGAQGAQGPQGEPGPAGGAGESSVNGITPGRSFPGRTVRLSISAVNTAWTAAPTVAFDDAAIAVSNVSLASPTALVAEITIGENATLGEKTITVDGNAYKGFRVEPALDVAYAGSKAQGSVLVGAIRNRDVENPFSSVSDFDTGNVGVGIGVSDDEIEPNLIQPLVFVDVDATGSANVGVVDSFSGLASYGAEPLSIEARAATPLPAEGAEIPLGGNFESKLYSYSLAGGENGAVVSFDVSAPATGSPWVLGLGPSGKWSDGETDLTEGAAFVARPGASTTGYAVLVDAAGAGGYNVSVALESTPFEGKEVEPNDSAATATAYTAAQKWFGDLPSQADVDWYKITVPVNNTLTVSTTGVEFVTIDSFLGPLSVGVDTVIEIYGAADTETPIATSEDEDADETLTTAALPAGEYLIKVTSEGYFMEGATAYQLLATLAAPPPP